MDAPFDLVESSKARNYRERLSKDDRERFGDKYEAIRANPLQFDELHGNLKGMHSARVGGYRVIFEIDLENRKVHVLAVQPRGQVYGRRRAP